MKYIALLRGINVGGKNLISMRELKSAFEYQGFENVITYINSGNLIFDSALSAPEVKSTCETAVTAQFGLSIPVGILTAEELAGYISGAPDWWGNEAGSRHDAILVMPPLTASEVISEIGEAKPEYEKVAYSGNMIYWSATIATMTKTRWLGIVKNKRIYNQVTIRNSNTIKKLAELSSIK